MKIRSIIKCLSVIALLLMGGPTKAQTGGVDFLSDSHVMYRVQGHSRYLLLPVEEKSEISHIRILDGLKLTDEINVRLSVDNVDYYVPYDLSKLGQENLLLDITTSAKTRTEGSIKGWVCWKALKLSDTFDTTNKERLRPRFHHSPLYGWMNDPNGMFYKDGLWHLYFQYNPYGSQWENMSWGHSVSSDLIHWKNQPVALSPDALGAIFSGSAVIDSNNTAGFGRGAIVAMFTSAKENQTQSIAYSTDGGMTFTKYTGNPVLTSDVPDFRDPKMFWNEDIKAWNLILAAGQEMRIYTSSNLLDWHYESSFGSGYGCHDGVWECPDLMKIHDNNEDKWVLICNINPGGPAGGSATQYFIGTFDGHKFVCQNPAKGEKPLWMDYGKDHYATVTFFNAPQGRHVALGWMSNWQYANQVPTKQYRSCNTLPRDLSLYEAEGETYLCVKPSPEVDALRGDRISQPSECSEIVVDIKGNASLTLSNNMNENVTLTYNERENILSFDRTHSGDVSFSNSFPIKVQGPTNGTIRRLRIFIDHCCIEVFDADGKIAMSNLVFPSSPYNKLRVSGKAKTKIYSLNK